MLMTYDSWLCIVSIVIRGILYFAHTLYILYKRDIILYARTYIYRTYLTSVVFPGETGRKRPPENVCHRSSMCVCVPPTMATVVVL